MSRSTRLRSSTACQVRCRVWRMVCGWPRRMHACMHAPLSPGAAHACMLPPAAHALSANPPAAPPPRLSPAGGVSVHVVSSVSQLGGALGALRASMQDSCIAVDLEWRPEGWAGNGPSRVALMQLASASTAVLVRISQLGFRMPPPLREFLRWALLRRHESGPGTAGCCGRTPRPAAPPLLLPLPTTTAATPIALPPAATLSSHSLASPGTARTRASACAPLGRGASSSRACWTCSRCALGLLGAGRWGGL